MLAWKHDTSAESACPRLRHRPQEVLDAAHCRSMAGAACLLQKHHRCCCGPAGACTLCHTALTGVLEVLSWLCELMQEYETAVTLLLDACNKLARLEFERVGALRDMKRAMAARRNALHKIIVHVSPPPWPTLTGTTTSTICTYVHTIAQTS